MFVGVTHSGVSSTDGKLALVVGSVTLPFSRPVRVASCPVVGNVFGLTPWLFRYVMIGAPFSSFGMTAELAVECAVKADSNSVWATVGVHVPAVLAASVYLPDLKYEASTSL